MASGCVESKTFCRDTAVPVQLPLQCLPGHRSSCPALKGLQNRGLAASLPGERASSRTDDSAWQREAGERKALLGGELQAREGRGR